MKIIVASTNPVKIASVKNAFAAMFPDILFMIEGHNPGLDLPAQPMSDTETKYCATARLDAVCQKHPDADYWVSIEAGVDINDQQQMSSLGWIAIQNKQGHRIQTRTATCPLPNRVAQLVQSGVELGHANDHIFNLENSKHDLGLVGIVTHGLINRTASAEQALIFALAPFRNASIYFPAEKSI